MWGLRDKLFEAKSKKMFAQAQSFISEGKLPEAQILCDKMIERKYSGGWELKAQVLSKQERPEQARQVLEELLGLNLAHSANKQEEIDAYTRYIRHLVRADMFETILEISEQNWYLDRNEVLGYAADESLKCGRTKKGRSFALTVAQNDHDNQDMFWYIREADGIRTPKNVMRKLLVSGLHNFNQKETCVQYHVASETLEQALEFVSEVEPEIPNLKLAEILSEEPRPEIPSGVYWRSVWVSSSSEPEGK